MKEADVIKSLAALAQPNRLQVFRALVVAGGQGMQPSQLAGRFKLPAATLSFHLKELSAAGLLESHSEGRFVIYSTRFDRMNELVAFLTSNCCGGNPCTPVTVCLPPKRADKAKV